MNNIRFLFQGEGVFALSCLKEACELGHDALTVISLDDEIIDFCRSEQIVCVDAFPEKLSDEVDCIFSINGDLSAIPLEIERPIIFPYVNKEQLAEPGSVERCLCWYGCKAKAYHQLWEEFFIIDNNQRKVSGYLESVQESFAALLVQLARLDDFADLTDISLSEESVAQPDLQNNLLAANHYQFFEKEEQDRVLYQWNQTDVDYPKDKTINQLFEEQVDGTLDNVALVFEGEQLTYKELNERANQLARYISEQYQQQTDQVLTPDTLIALCLNRSLEMIIAILAVLKAGGAYVPIDPSYPDERIVYILDDTQTSLVLTQDDYANRLRELANDKEYAIIALDKKLQQQLISKQSSKNLEQNSQSNDLAYVIYTSGTTGNPKGVMVEQRSVINMLIDLQKAYILTEKSKVTEFTNYVFDVSVSEIFSTFLRGASLYLLSDFMRSDCQALSEYLVKHKITHAYLPPVLLSRLQKIDYPHLQTIVYAGEPLDYRSGKYWSEKLRLFNYYGPTEATVYATGNKLIDGNVGSIGKPIQNSQAYILDANLNPVPIGVVGELYIGGVGLARGYLNRAHLTEERFIANPFASESDKAKGYTRLYKTGDLVRWLSDGNIEYIGRNDFQVKIRGYRIELGEIENALSQIKGVSQCAVLAKERELNDGGKNQYLVGYYVRDGESDLVINDEYLVEQLSNQLPDYMVPSAFVVLGALPLTINGKLDRKALPNPDFSGDVDMYVAPRNELEQSLCQIWQELLGIERVGIRDDFFRLGGNSILAIQLAAKISECQGNAYDSMSILDARTIEQLVASNVFPIDFAAIKPDAKDYNRLHHFEQLLLQHQLVTENPLIYNESNLIELQQGVDFDQFQDGVSTLLTRYDILNANYSFEDNQFVRSIHKDSQLVCEQLFCDDKQALRKLLSEMERQSFDLARDKLIRFYLIELPTTQYIWIQFYHTICDATSIINILLPALYQSLTRQQTLANADAHQSIEQYDQCAQAIAAYYQHNYDQKLVYWQALLPSCDPIDLSKSVVSRNNAGEQIDFVFSGGIYQSAKSVSKNLNISFFANLYGLFSLLMGRLSGFNQVAIRTNIDERLYVPKYHDIVGSFINNTFITTNLEEMTLSDYLLHTHKQVSETIKQAVPFSDLLNINQSLVESLSDVHFNLESEAIHQLPYDETQSWSHSGQVKSGLYVEIEAKENKLYGRVEYQSEKYDRWFIESLLASYGHLLAVVFEHLDQSIYQLPLLPQQQYEQIIHKWNDTGRDCSRDKTIVQLFEGQVAKTPNNVALVFEGEQLTYQELNQRANQLARYIREQYQQQTGELLKADTLIALYLDRSLEMIISILAVLKAGGAYVPIDRSYPDERVGYMLRDTQTQLILTQQHYVKRLFQLRNDARCEALVIKEAVVLALDEEGHREKISKQLPDNLEVNSQASDLAYIIYTSGTTGQPKGVMIEQSAVLSLIFAMEKSLGRHLSYAFLSSPVFDAATFEIWCSLLSGAKLVLPADMIKTVGSSLTFKYFLEKNKIDILWLTKTLFDSLYLQDRKLFSSLSSLVVGGEALNVKLIKEFSSYNAATKIFNGYGPTESTTFAAFYDCSQLNQKATSIPIGKAIANRTVYVVDNHLNPVPIGVMGELYIGGAGLARGYLNRVELTKERFIPNPFSTELDKTKGYTRLYKTGDLVRWLPDGNIEYIGRNDFQVKIRGYRIELGEIESALSQIVGISQCVVLVKERELSDGGKREYLVGYYVLSDQVISEGGKEASLSDDVHITIDADYLIAQLSQSLPAYMVPSTFVALEALPLTINGKLDRKMLPDLDFSGEMDAYVAPRTEVEEQLCAIWTELLGIEQVGVRDDFFRLGGNSILAIQLIARIKHRLNQELAIADIFQYRIIERIANQLLSSSREMITILTRDQHHPILSFAQQRLWFIEQYEGGTNAYHIPILLELSNRLDFQLFEQALNALLGRHEVLRSVFKQDEQGRDYQLVLSDRLKVAQYVYTLKERKVYELQLDEDVNTPFSLRESYPIRVSVYQLGKGKRAKRYALINVHHVAFDGWSVNILLRDLAYFYQRLSGLDQAHELPMLSVQYKDYAAWQRDYLSGDRLSEQLSYWKARLSGYEPLNLSLDYPRPSQVDYRGKSIKLLLSASLSVQLRRQAKQLGCSLYSLLLSGFYVLLGKYTGQEDIVIGSPIANRHYAQIQELIGFFVNSLALREKLDGSQSLAALVKKVQAHQIAAQCYQDIPFEQLVELLNIERDTSRHPIFQILFGVQGAWQGEGGEFALAGDKGNDALWQRIAANDDQIGEEGIYRISKFDLEVMVDDSVDQLSIWANYQTALFEKGTIKRLIDYYEIVLSMLVSEPERSIRSVNLLSNLEYQRIVHSWNQTDVDYPKDKTLNQLFEEQVARTPNNVALVFEDQQLTYQAFNERANQLARYIREQYQQQSNQALTPDTLIALCLDRSLEMIIAILAVLKTGGAYVPMDPGYPDERIVYILGDTQTSLILTQNPYIDRLRQLTSNTACTVIALDKQSHREVIRKQSSNNLEKNSQPNDLAYVIYTSGTTGKPKGVMVEHKSISQLIFSKNFKLPKSRSSFWTSYVFDVSVYELFQSLVMGSELYVVTDAVRLDTIKYLEYLYVNEIEAAYIPPFFIASLNNLLLNRSISIKYILTGVEKIRCLDVKNIFQHNIKLINAYGPTESTVCSTAYLLENPPDSSCLPIGRPLDNEKAYILDANLNPVPIGVVGELYIGGAGLARGYLNRPELTAERFIENPFASESDKMKGYTRLYKTGDLVRWLPDGNIEYIGRNDFQVKIRGYRIELGEIENTLSQIKGISQCAVLAKERELDDGGKNQYLVGYYMRDGESDLAINDEYLIEQLLKQLPDYMVPSIFVALDALPLTINGKLDRKALPNPNFNGDVDMYVAPRSETEEQLCKLWEELLGVDRVGIRDDFFRLGGNSILAIQLVSQINKVLGSSLSVADVFKDKSIEQLIKRIVDDNSQNKLVKSLNIISKNKPYVFFVHAAHGGCEVYQAIADKGNSFYQSIGIDNYNLMNADNQIDNLYQLVGIYLDNIIDYFKDKSCPIYLAGWSLGGQIALEMAVRLEKMGYRHVNLFLFDTFIRNEDNMTDEKANQYEHLVNGLPQEVGNADLGEDYKHALLKILPSESNISSCSISSSLQFSNIALFQAMKMTSSQQGVFNKSEFKDVKVKQVVNIERLMASKNMNLKVVELDCHHYNILQIGEGNIVNFLKILIESND